MSNVNRFVVIITVFVTLSVVVVGISQQNKNPLPDFTQYQNVKAKKLAFFNYILPLVQAQNATIKNQREQLNTTSKIISYHSMVLNFYMKLHHLKVKDILLYSLNPKVSYNFLAGVLGLSG